MHTLARKKPKQKEPTKVGNREKLEAQQKE